MEDAFQVSVFALRTGVESDDRDLVEACKQDPNAFGELYERYYVRVYRYVFHRTSNETDAEDITAVIFMKALEGLATYRPARSNFAPWLFRIARNSVVDHYRRQRLHPPSSELTEGVGESSEDPAALVMGRERRQELQGLVQHLSSEQRDVVLMRYAADLSFSEIAAVLQKNEPAVRMLLHRGLRKLKAIIDEG